MFNFLVLHTRIGVPLAAKNLADRNLIYNICRLISHLFQRPYQGEKACWNKGHEKETAKGALTESSFENSGNKMPRGNYCYRLSYGDYAVAKNMALDTS